MLADIRGISFADAEEEFNDIVNAVEASKKIKHPWRTIVRPKYRPQLMLAITSTFFQQWTGINTIIFYAPQLFVSLGVGPVVTCKLIVPYMSSCVPNVGSL